MDKKMAENDQQPTESVFICPECHTGILRLEYLTYFTWLNQELITVPNFPAWVCDVCGRREYDSRAISWLNTLLNPSAGKRPGYPRKGNVTGIDRLNPDDNYLTKRGN
jgi:YgiT-type zinc finger domain-containing protein